MDRVVVDTDVVSFCFKNDTRFRDYAPLIAGKQLVISFITLAELRLWQELRKWSQNRRDNFFAELDELYSVYPVDRELCFMWAELTAAAKQMGECLNLQMHGAPQLLVCLMYHWSLTTRRILPTYPN